MCAKDITCSLGLLGYRHKVDLSVFTYNCLAKIEEQGRSQDPQTWSVKKATVAFHRVSLSHLNLANMTSSLLIQSFFLMVVFKIMKPHHHSDKANIMTTTLYHKDNGHMI